MTLASVKGTVVSQSARQREIFAGVRWAFLVALEGGGATTSLQVVMTTPSDPVIVFATFTMGGSIADLALVQLIEGVTIDTPAPELSLATNLNRRYSNIVHQTELQIDPVTSGGQVIGEANVAPGATVGGGLDIVLNSSSTYALSVSVAAGNLDGANMTISFSEYLTEEVLSTIR